ncbi:MAG: tetratricopeptide repeat protein [Candidatus Thorarchaeota archaeon]|nr:MAG: tetratricopeptide repeat protein [Candidatus Thorarchaeota archaeon]
MYEYFEPSEKVFVDREEYIDWMDQALQRCKKKSVVLHIRGIGGIGKSSLMEYWRRSIDSTIRLDCEQHTEFFSRLDTLARAVVRLGIQLRRFDTLWHIRKRFFEGVEPAKEPGREWAKEVLVAIPFIGSLASIASAITAVGQKVAPKFKSKYGDVANWLQTRLGEDYIGRLLEILWKEPRHAEFIYLDALLEDLNNRRERESPLLILLDHFEYVDDEQKQWRYRSKNITEAELWFVFLSSAKNSVGVMASRHAAPKTSLKELEFEEQELVELDSASSVHLLEEHGVNDNKLQSEIVNVSGGNPFVIEAICDMIETSEVSVDDIEDLRAGTLPEVRLKVWRRLFSQAEGLLDLINRAGVVPYFDERIMSAIAPEITSDSLNRFLQLSFLNERDDKTFVLHKLAKDLVMAELGKNVKNLALDVGNRLEEVSKEETDYTLRGLSLSAKALAEEPEALKDIDQLVFSLLFEYDTPNVMRLLDAFSIESAEGRIVKETWRGYAFSMVMRFAEADDAIRNAQEIAQSLYDRGPQEKRLYLGRVMWFQGRYYEDVERSDDALAAFRKASQILKETEAKGKHESYMKEEFLTSTLHILGRHLASVYRLEEAEELTREAISLLDKQSDRPELVSARRRETTLRYSQLSLSQALYASGRIDEAIEVLKAVLAVCDESAIVDDARFRLAYILMFQRRHNESFRIFEEQLEKVERLARKDPDYQYGVTNMLSHTAAPLALTGRYRKAERVMNQVVSEFRKSVDEGDPTRRQMLARVLRDFATLLALLGQLSEARERSLESEGILRELAKENPDRFVYRLGTALNSLGVIGYLMDESEKAADSLQEAYGLAREMTLKFPETIFMADVFSAVANNLGLHHRKNNRMDDAEKFLREALDGWKERSIVSPEMFRCRVATSLNNLGVLLCETDRIAEAESSFKESLKIRRDYVERSPDFFLPRVASVLNNLGILSRRAGKSSQAEDAHKEAIEILEELAEKEPRVFKNDLIRTFSNALVLYSTNEKLTDADRIKKSLKRLGVREFASEERWSEDAVFLQGF